MIILPKDLSPSILVSLLFLFLILFHGYLGHCYYHCRDSYRRYLHSVRCCGCCCC